MVIKPEEKYKQVISSPVNKVIDEINNKKKDNVFLVGDISCGKSVVMNAYLSSYDNPEHALIDGTVKYGEFVDIPDFELVKLYHTCLILQKMLLFVKQKHPQKYMEYFVGFESRIDVIYRKIDLIYLIGSYSKKTEKIGNFLLENPEILLEEFMSIATKVLDYKTITLAIDNFDSVGSSSLIYQKYLYNVLSQYVGLIATISDRSVINSQERQEKLKKDNDLVLVDYSQDVEVVKELMDIMNSREMIRLGNPIYKTPVSLILRDETISLMIQKTNGHIGNMAYAVRTLYQKMNDLMPAQYDAFLLNFIDTEINKNPILTGNIILERKLHI